MTLAVGFGRKATKQTNKQTNRLKLSSVGGTFLDTWFTGSLFIDIYPLQTFKKPMKEPQASGVVNDSRCSLPMSANPCNSSEIFLVTLKTF